MRMFIALAGITLVAAQAAGQTMSDAIRRIYSGTGVWAGHAHWQSTTL